MSDSALETQIGVLLALMVLFYFPVAYRILRASHQAERLQGLDAFSQLLIGSLILLGLLQETGMMIDVALALAAFSFIATLGIARYVIQGKVF